MSPDKEHTPALMQQAADEAVLPERLMELSEMLSIEKPALSLALLTAARTITRLQFRTRYTDIGEVSGVYEQGVAAGLEMAAKVAEKALEPLAKLSSDVEWDDVPDNARADVVYRSEAGGEESIGTIAFADFRRARAAIRALADQHKPSPAGEPRP